MLPLGSTAVSKVYEQAYRKHLEESEQRKLQALAEIEQAAIKAEEDRQAQELAKATEIIQMSLRPVKGSRLKLKEAALQKHRALTDAGNNVIFYYSSSRKFYKYGHSTYLRRAEVLKQFKYSLCPVVVLSYESLQDITTKALASLLETAVVADIRTSSAKTLLQFAQTYDKLSELLKSVKTLEGVNNHEQRR